MRRHGNVQSRGGAGVGLVRSLQVIKGMHGRPECDIQVALQLRLQGVICMVMDPVQAAMLPRIHI